MKKFYLLILVAVVTFGANAQRGYEKSIELTSNTGFGELKNHSFGVGMINGYRLNDYLFGGIGFWAGFSNRIAYLTEKIGYDIVSRRESYPVPVFATIKVNLTAPATVQPYVQGSVGYTIDLKRYLNDAPGLMIEPAMGLIINFNSTQALYLSAGINIQHDTYRVQTGEIPYMRFYDGKTYFKAVSAKIGFKF